MDIFDEEHLQLIRHLHVEVEANRRIAIAGLLDQQTKRIALGGRELRRVAPQLAALELLAVPQAHHQGGPHRLPLAAGTEDVRLMRNVFLPPVLRGEDEVSSMRCVLGAAEQAEPGATLQELLKRLNPA